MATFQVLDLVFFLCVQEFIFCNLLSSLTNFPITSFFTPSYQRGIGLIIWTQICSKNFVFDIKDNPTTSYKQLIWAWPSYFPPLSTLITFSPLSTFLIKGLHEWKRLIQLRLFGMPKIIRMCHHFYIVQDFHRKVRKALWISMGSDVSCM